MTEQKFVGRRDELKKLNNLSRKKTSSLVVIKGRRRVGKSRLIDEFLDGKTFYRFIGLAPDKKTTAQDQRDHFALQLNQLTNLPKLKTEDWSELFILLAERVNVGKVVLVFDEITWMGNKDSNFLAKLHYAWENFYKHNPQLILIICGSVSSWIEKNILSSTGYFGRLSLKLSLYELSLT